MILPCKQFAHNLQTLVLCNVWLNYFLAKRNKCSQTLNKPHSPRVSLKNAIPQKYFNINIIENTKFSILDIKGQSLKHADMTKALGENISHITQNQFCY